MNFLVSSCVFIGFLIQVQVNAVGTRITLDENAQTICKKYKMMCKAGKICAMQHFDNWHRNITIPVCVPLSFVPDAYKEHVRSLICELPPDPGECGARYLRWYYNRHSGQCAWFTYGGCKGNQNNFKYKKECEDSCIGARQRDGALAGLSPSIMTAPVFEAPEVSKHESLNSVMVGGDDNGYDRYPIRRQRKVKEDKDRRRKRRRLNKEKRRRQLRRERKRQKRLLRKKQGKPDKEPVKEERKERKKRNNKRSKKNKKKNREPRTTEMPNVQELVQKPEGRVHKMFQILDKNGESDTTEQQSSLLHTLS